MTQSRQLLTQILIKMRSLHQQSTPFLVVYDLDSTLFNVAPRLQKILSDFAEVEEHKKKFPQQIPLFKEVQTAHTDWGIKNALQRAGLDGHHPEFEQAIKQYWLQHFFSNEYLKYDIPYDGAIEFVKATAHAGAHIVYLTGRDIERMGEGTEETLHNWGFPLDHKKSKLVLKPHKKMDDADFKRDWFLTTTDSYKPIWFFENEPVNILLLQKELPHIEVIFLDTTHAGLAKPPTNIPWIVNFMFN